jgi:hypothetical protein
MNNRVAVEKILEEQLKIGAPITYSKLAKRAGLRPMDGAWKSHPLCEIFGQLDREDYPKPLRTSLVVGADSGAPGEGYFEALETLRGQTILESERIVIWIEQFNALLNARQQ